MVISGVLLYLVAIGIAANNVRLRRLTEGDRLFAASYPNRERIEGRGQDDWRPHLDTVVAGSEVELGDSHWPAESR